MDQPKLGFGAQLRSFPRPFYVANVMEIFERMAWYGFYALATLYITGPVETGGLGFTSEQRGAIQAMIPFLLYLMPVATGALADRYGFKKMFIISYLGMAVFYYLLGQFKSMSGFMLAFFGVAVAAAIFKPVVVGTVARVTDESNSRLGFGVFYMMVNIGGFVGPLVAGAIRGISWEYVFIASSAWAVINLLICLAFYKEPPRPAGWKPRTPSQVWQAVYEVLGNVRFFITVFVAIIAMMVAQFGPWWFQWWPHAAIFIPAWIVLNFLWDSVLPPHGAATSMNKAAPPPSWFGQRMHCSDWRFALFLLILSGFWTSFNQIFITMPEYIRDFSETKPLVDTGRKLLSPVFGDDIDEWLASVEETELYAEVDDMLRKAAGKDGLVPPDPSPAPSGEHKTRENRDAFAALGRQAAELSEDENLTESERAQAAAVTEALRQIDPRDDAAVEAALSTHQSAIGALEEAARLAAYQTFPGITPEVLSELTALVRRLNERGGATDGDGLTPLDVLDSCRKVLDYKVRFAPVAYAKTLVDVPLQPSAASDRALDKGVASLNKRLKEVRQPILDDVESDRVRLEVQSLLQAHGILLDAEVLSAAAEKLSTPDRRIRAKDLSLAWRHAAFGDALAEPVRQTRQFNPEFIVNLNAFGIVLFQVIVSYLIGRFHQFTGMILGMVVAAVGIGFAAVAGDHGFFGPGGIGLLVCLGILIFSFGEMMASPTSQEYVGRIAPEDKKALYMGYYFVAVALGNLFGGILSGQLYGSLARDMQRPDLMWLAFGGIMLATALIFLVYNRFALPKSAAKVG
ncbi:MAG: MFS transporter [Phycisphaerae bacterium]|nr:MAG: MFS transporter [Phycisphaerae bacterium]MBE7456868.1 MFS transporter [Planctomycetia bacterium]MCQ3919875.1 hypothetical protein [Planctomycetota bacterium]MCK6464315.1 MFS transporter [Phycisphaerae bacterium]MCL4717908.1 MFS transporter [Phycisphaerae bacterium]